MVVHLALGCVHLVQHCVHLALGCVHLVHGCVYLALGCMHLALGCVQHVQNLDSVMLYWHIFVTFNVLSFDILSLLTF